MVVGGVLKKAAVQLREALQAETGLDTDDFDTLIGARQHTIRSAYRPSTRTTAR